MGEAALLRAAELVAPLVGAPSTWLVENADLLPAGGRCLDVAAGRGRHALLLAAAGFEVRAVDHDPAAVAALREAGGRAGLEVQGDVLDLERGTPDLGEAAYGLIVVFNYLHRPLFPALARALRAGGLLLYETFTLEQARRGRPRNPAFLLRAGELVRLVEPLEVVRAWEGERDGRFLAAVAARKTA